MPRAGRESDGDPEPGRFDDLIVGDEAAFCDLLECVLGLTEPDAEAYRHVIDRPSSTVKELSRAMDRDPSTVNRRLDSLHEKGLVARRRNLLSGGGVVYRYEPTSLDRIEARMHRTIDEWASSLHERVDSTMAA